ncbi:MAG: hypothetical protein ACYST5_20120 [Planctomycetota bacterium]
MKRETKHETRSTKLQKQNVIQSVLFVVFFSIGAISLGASILTDDFVRYYRNRQLVKSAQESLDRLKSLNIDYDVLLEHLEKDPNLFKRIASATLGTEPEDANAIHPKATAEQLAVARRVLAEEPNQQPAEPVMPLWLTRCSEPSLRIMLFFSGGALILISFICFGPARQTPKKQER